MTIRIGDFSRLRQVTVNTLHHYDEINLLKPAHVDPGSGYRYYTAAQLRRLEQIRLLKEIDFSLDEIGVILDGDLSTVELRDMLKAKRVALQSMISERQEQLARIDARLSALDKVLRDDYHMVTIKNIQSIRVIAWRGTLDNTAEIRSIFQRVTVAVRDAKLSLPPRPWLALYHHDGFRETNIDFEIAIPIPVEFERTLVLDEDRVMVLRELPPAMMACITIDMQTLEDVRAGNQILAQWVADNGYELIDGIALRELYADPPHDSGAARFEMQYPVRRTTSAR